MNILKKISLIALTVMPATLLAQVDFSVIGKVDGLGPDAKAYLHYVKDSEVTIDSAAVNDGTFKFHGTANEPSLATVLLMHQGEDLFQTAGPDMLEIYLEHGAISISSADSLANATVSGGRLNTEFSAYKTKANSIREKMLALRGSYLNASEEERQDPRFIATLQAGIDGVQYEQRNMIVNHIDENPNSLLSLDLLSMMLESESIQEVIEPAFNKLGASIRNSAKGREMAAQIQTLRATEIGAIAPDFTLPDTAGNAVALSSLRGQYVLIDFWASWCAPCREENPNLVAAYEAFKDRNFTILGVSLDRPGQRSAWLKAISDDNLQGWTQVSDLKFMDSEPAKLYSITYIPKNYLLDPEGRIIAKDLRGPDLHYALDDILND